MFLNEFILQLQKGNTSIKLTAKIILFTFNNSHRFNIDCIFIKLELKTLGLAETTKIILVMVRIFEIVTKSLSSGRSKRLI